MAGGANPAATATPQAATNVYDQSSAAYTGALGATQGAMGGPNIGQFMNPYTSMVTDATMGNLEDQRLMAQNNTAAQAQAAGAFGGSRHGVADALTNQAYGDTAASTYANLQNQGFNTALGAAQNQQNIGLQGANQLGSLSNLGFNYGQQIAGQQGTQGATQQNAMQAIIDAARGQYGGFANAPTNAVGLLTNTATAGNMGQGAQTQTYNPGLFDYATLGLGLL